MADIAKKRRQDRIRRHKRIRKSVIGTAERPRLAVFRSNRHISVQVIDDLNGVTIASASTNEADLVKAIGSNIGAAGSVGTLIAKRAKEAGIDTVVFDRGGFRYHGRVAALADAAREEGLQF